MMQTLGQLTEDLPLLCAFAVNGGGGGGRGVWVGGCLGGAGHVGAPDGVDAEVFVEDHEEVVEPALAEAFVLEVGVVGVGGVRLEGGDVSYCGRHVQGGWMERGLRLRCRTSLL